MLVTTQIHTRIFTNPNILKEDISVQNQQISENEAICNHVDHPHKAWPAKQPQLFHHELCENNPSKRTLLKRLLLTRSKSYLEEATLFFTENY